MILILKKCRKLIHAQLTSSAISSAHHMLCVQRLDDKYLVSIKDINNVKRKVTVEK